MELTGDVPAVVLDMILKVCALWAEAKANTTKALLKDAINIHWMIFQVYI